MNDSELDRLRRRAARERAARKEAERLAEEKTLELYLANQRLKEFAGELEQAVATRTAELLEANRRLRKEIAERQAAERAREKTFAETRQALLRTEALYRAGRALVHSRELDDLLQAVVESALEAVGADRTQLFGIDVEQEIVTYSVRAGPGRRQTDDLTFADLMEGLSGWAIRNLAPANSPRGHADPRESETVAQRRQARQAGAIVVVPLRYGDRVMGTLTAVNRIDQRNFTEDDVEVLLALAGQAAAAIANAELMEEALQARLEAESANQAKSRFLANMSHELRTPLNGILGYARLLQRDDALPQRVEDALDIIEQSGDHLLMLINDILDLSKIEAEQMELAPTEFHLREFLEMISAIIRMRAEQKGISYVCYPDDALPQVVYADERRLRQILLNILGNAVKFTNTGGVTFRIDRYDARLCFTVADTGAGIPAGELSSIFLPFHQTGTHQARAEGTGLGLAISQQLLKVMGSFLNVESVPNHGSTFWFELVLPECAGPSAPRSVDDGKIVGYQGVQRRLLVVDDNPANRSLLQAALRSVGFAVEEAASGEEALAVFDACTPDLVLMDLVMAGLDGFATTRAIQARLGSKAPPVIAVSASVLDLDKTTVAAAGMADFLVKPIDLDALFAAIQDALALTWTYVPRRSTPASHTPRDLADSVIPLSQNLLYDLRAALRIGDIAKLDTLLQSAAATPSSRNRFLAQLQELLREFRLDEMEQVIVAELQGTES